jgi:phage anti-repressor protein
MKNLEVDLEDSIKLVSSVMLYAGIDTLTLYSDWFDRMSSGFLADIDYFEVYSEELEGYSDYALSQVMADKIMTERISVNEFEKLKFNMNSLSTYH